MDREEREFLLDLAELVRGISRGIADLIRGHNALVHLVKTEGAHMSAVSDAILAEDTKTVTLVTAVMDLINKLNNGNNKLDAETTAALATLDGHLNTVTQEVADAQGSTTPTDGPTPAEGGPDAGTVGV